MRRRSLIIPLVALTVFILDQVSKFLVSANLELDQPWYPFSFVKPIFALTYIHNSGAAFGIFQNQNLFFSIVAVVVIIVILAYLRATPQPDPLIALSLGLQLGAACGNLTDRLRFGYVIDFLHLKYWAISNVADVSITLGVILLGYHLIFRMNPPAQAQTVSVATSPASSSPTIENKRTEDRRQDIA